MMTCGQNLDQCAGATTAWWWLLKAVTVYSHTRYDYETPTVGGTCDSG